MATSDMISSQSNNIRQKYILIKNFNIEYEGTLVSIIRISDKRFTFSIGNLGF